jgi:hypothetical protein
MKKFILVASVILISLFSLSCNQHNDKKDFQSQTEGPVPNVNGNIPDTTSTVGVPGSNTDTSSTKTDTSLENK